MSTREIEIIGRDGARRTERDGYALRDGERIASVRVPMVMMDASAGPGRVTITDSTSKVAIGDAVSTQTVDGMETVRFADGSGAMKTPGGWSYFWSNGQQARSLTRDQQAHQAKANGATLRQWADAYVEGEGNRLAARTAHEAAIANAWRG